MSHHTSIRRGASALGASGLIALAVVAPASARPDPGTGGRHERYSVAEQRWVDPNQEVVTRTPIDPRDTDVLGDDNALEYLQLGAGVLAGIALAGVGAVMISRRGHAPSQAHPA